jgi:hypothetical protein
LAAYHTVLLDSDSDDDDYESDCTSESDTSNVKELVEDLDEEAESEIEDISGEQVDDLLRQWGLLENIPGKSLDSIRYHTNFFVVSSPNSDEDEDSDEDEEDLEESESDEESDPEKVVDLDITEDDKKQTELLAIKQHQHNFFLDQILPQIEERTGLGQFYRDAERICIENERIALARQKTFVEEGKGKRKLIEAGPSGSPKTKKQK